MRSLTHSLAFLLGVAALCSTPRSQDFLIDWVGGGPSGQVSVNLGTGVWEDHESGDGGTAHEDGGDIVLLDDLGLPVRVLKGAVGAKGGDTGTVEEGSPPQTVGDWTCVEF
jgi:hypothetical protein